MFDVQSTVPAAAHSTMRAGGFLEKFVTVSHVEDIPEACALAARTNLPLLILGGGSNIVFGDNLLPYFVVRMNIQGITIEHEDKDTVTIQCGAGVVWDTLVAWCTQRSYSGLELLSLIPGTTGAAPVQNIGAYGTEFATIATRINFFDTETKQFSSFTKDECMFDYRTSIFKREPNRRVVTSVILTLSKKNPPIPTHPEISKELEAQANNSQGDVTQNCAAIREAVIAVRTQKLPDPNIIPNCGSFFMNPIVDSSTAERITQEFSNVPTYPAKNGIKLSAGWLIERAGYKGFIRGATGTHDKHALVVVNRGGATGSDIKAVANEIAEAVFNRFGVRLVPEVNFYF